MRTGTTSSDELAQRVARLLPGFRAEGSVRATRKSWLLEGTVEGREVLAKACARTAGHWRWYARREAEVLRVLGGMRAPVRVPKLLAADDDGLVVMERIAGEPIAATRRTGEPLARGLVPLAERLRAWKAGAALSPGPALEAKDRRALRRSLLEDPSAPVEWILEGMDECRRRKLWDRAQAQRLARAVESYGVQAFAHGDLMPRNALRSGRALVLIDWECAGTHLDVWDEALLWANAAGARSEVEAVIEAGSAGRRAAFWATAAFALARELAFLGRRKAVPSSERAAQLIRAELVLAASRVESGASGVAARGRLSLG